MNIFEKILDMRPERERARKEEIAKRQEAYKKEREALNVVIPEIKLMSDWRVEQEYNLAVEPERTLFPHQRIPAKKKFLEDAVKNRHNLKELIVEDHQKEHDLAYEVRGCNVSFETDEETLDILNKEARRHGLSLEAYIRAIFYTTAFEINEAKRKRKKEYEKWLEENAIVDLGNGREIKPELRKKLEEKFGRKFSYRGVANLYDCIDLLLYVAKEYFGI